MTTREDLVDGLRAYLAGDIWRAYLPAEPVRVRSADLERCQGRVWWDGETWRMELARGDDWRERALHEVAHVALGHVKRRVPEEVKAGRVDDQALLERMRTLSRLAERVIAKQEAEADAWAEQERPKWAC